MFLRQAIRERRIPFELKLDIPNAETLAAIEEIRQMKKNPSKGEAYSDVDEMMQDLLK
jgi:DNA-damage-inducible protein J